ncbi:hypothetical protein CCYA_CCYA01G0022 [Cyanidiococcus yangmingshanensis]|nr:hypothetical protein CCYA_CCYA01G0022 [Cyanidiococcus yangmingshanensis]
MEQRAAPHPAVAVGTEMDAGSSLESDAGATRADSKVVEHDQTAPTTSTTTITRISAKRDITEMDHHLGDDAAPSSAVPQQQRRAQRELLDRERSALETSLPSPSSLNTQDASPRTGQVGVSNTTMQPTASSAGATPTTTDACADASAASGIVVANTAPLLLPRRKRGRPRKEELLARKQQLVTETSAPVLNNSHQRWRASISSVDIPRTVHIMYDYPETKNRHGVGAISRPVERCISVEELESLSGKKQPETRVPAIKLSEPFPASATVRVLRIPRRVEDALSMATKTRISVQTATDKSLLENAVSSEENFASDQVIELVSSKTATPSARQSKGI